MHGAYNGMRYEWDEVKAMANVIKHGVEFEEVVEFAWEASVEVFDSRKNYKECSATIPTSRILGRLHVLVYTRRGDSVRVVSLRKANTREIRKYEQAQKS